MAAFTAIVLSSHPVCAAGSAALFTVCLKEQASVLSAAPVLADIAELTGEDAAVLARLAALPLGRVLNVRLVSRSEIISLVRGVLPDSGQVSVTGAEFARISVVTRTPEAAEIVAILKSRLAAISPWREEEIEIRTIGDLKNVSLPPGDLQLRVAGRSAPANCRNALWLVEAVLDGRLLRSFWVKADVRVRGRVVRLARPVPFRRTLQAEDLQEEVSDIENLGADYFRTSIEAIGMTAKRALGKGELLSRSCVNEINLVRSGQTVRLQAQSGDIVITALVRALQNGKLGDRVKVRNLDSDREISAVVTGQGEVRIAN